MDMVHWQKMQLEFKWLAEKSASLFIWRKRMAKDKDKKNKKKNKDIDSLVKEYNDGIEILKAKQKQLDGLIQEARLYISELKELKEGLQKMSMESLDEID